MLMRFVRHGNQTLVIAMPMLDALRFLAYLFLVVREVSFSDAKLEQYRVPNDV